MAIVAESEGATRVLRLSGQFDFSCRNEFRSAYLSSPKGATFIVDMTDVDYLDSAALGMLLLLRDYSATGTRVAIRGVKGQAEQVLRIANFQKLFQF
jgi:anti-anti-sigma factor